MADELRAWPDAAAFMGEAYLRYSFTKGTRQEVEFLVEELDLRAGDRVLDVGCGPGRHAWAFAERGIEVVGVDLAPAFALLADAGPPGGVDPGSGRPRFLVGDARRLPVRAGTFSVVLSLCQGGFGLMGDDDPGILAELARALGPGGRVVLSAFSSYFAVRHIEETDDFDAGRGVNTERTAVRDHTGTSEAAFVMETSCFTPRELRLLATAAGLEVHDLWSVTPGSYARRAPDLRHPELLLVAGVAAAAR